ncbi:hypothetical protein KM043_011415 [Ampulex compressa]|nr:hypothetical protein KM043_011415 [Ampulex compressa]
MRPASFRGTATSRVGPGGFRHGRKRIMVNTRSRRIRRWKTRRASSASMTSPWDVANLVDDVNEGSYPREIHRTPGIPQRHLGVLTDYKHCVHLQVCEGNQRGDLT